MQYGQVHGLTLQNLRHVLWLACKTMSPMLAEAEAVVFAAATEVVVALAVVAALVAEVKEVAKLLVLVLLAAAVVVTVGAEEDSPGTVRVPWVWRHAEGMTPVLASGLETGVAIGRLDKPEITIGPALGAPGKGRAAPRERKARMMVVGIIFMLLVVVVVVVVLRLRLGPL